MKINSTHACIAKCFVLGSPHFIKNKGLCINKVELKDHSNGNLVQAYMHTIPISLKGPTLG